MSEFEPPITNSEILSYHEISDGFIDKATLAITDAKGQSFTLAVESQIEHDKRLIDEVRSEGVPEGEAEPVFVMPGDKLGPEDLDEVLGLPAKTLSRYLVRQELEQE